MLHHSFSHVQISYHRLFFSGEELHRFHRRFHRSKMRFEPLCIILSVLLEMSILILYDISSNKPKLIKELKKLKREMGKEKHQYFFISNLLAYQLKINLILFYMSTNAPFGRPVSGSKPKKHITKMSYNNPSLVSNSVTALFKYPVVAQSPTMAQKSPTRFPDSLSKAQHEFVQRKQQPTSRLSQNQQIQRAQNSQRLSIQRRFSTPSMPANSYQQSKYHFMNHEGIKSKQNHGYNIINNFPSQFGK